MIFLFCVIDEENDFDFKPTSRQFNYDYCNDSKYLSKMLKAILLKETLLKFMAMSLKTIDNNKTIIKQ